MVKLDIGGGFNPKEGFKSVDKSVGSSYQINLENERLPFEDETIEEIYTNHTLEHIENIAWVMNEMWRVLKWGGKLEIIVPHHESTIAFQDPTHKRFFNAQSMKYFEGYYINKHVLFYNHIVCAFKELENTTKIVDAGIKGGGTLPYYREQRFVLEKNQEWWEKNKPFYCVYGYESPCVSGKGIDEEQVYEMFTIEQEKALQLFKKKNKDYGNNYFNGEHELPLIFGNLTRKFNRLKGFYESKKEYLVGDETVEDTLRDLAIYCTMEIVRLEGEKKKVK